MRIYRMIWRVTCTAVTVFGIVVALSASPVTAASVAVPSAIVGAIVALTVRATAGTPPGTHRAAFMLRWTTMSAVAAVSGVGLSVALDAWVIPVALWLLLCSPELVGRYYCRWQLPFRPWIASCQAAVPFAIWASPWYVPDPPPELCTISDEELCQRWRASCTRLATHPDAADWAGIAEERRSLLEEAERRNPAGLAAWITSPHPSPAALHYHLTQTHACNVRVDWDAFPS